MSYFTTKWITKIQQNRPDLNYSPGQTPNVCQFLHSQVDSLVKRSKFNLLKESQKLKLVVLSGDVTDISFSSTVD